MNKYEDIAQALKVRLSQLTSRVAEIDSELRKPLSADSEDRVTDLETHAALEGIEISAIREIQQIGEALKRSLRWLRICIGASPCETVVIMQLLLTVLLRPLDRRIRSY